MSYRGDINLGDTIDIKFCTVTTTGAPTTLAGTPVISAYLDNNVTQLTAGITLTVDFDGVTGLNNIRVVATSGNGYATATNYDLIITTGTVGGTSVVGYVVGSFSIEKRSAGLRPATAGRTVVVDANGLIDSTAVKIGPTGAGTAQTAGDLATMITAVDDFVDTEVAAIKTKTDFLPSATAGAAGGLFIAGANAATTVNITGNLSGSVGSVTGAVGSVTGSIGSVAAGGITTASFGAGAIDAAAIGAGAIDADAIATDAFGSVELAADAVNEIRDAITGVTMLENAQGIPGATPTMMQLLMYMYMDWRNLNSSTATAKNVTNDAGTVICKATLSDDGTTFTKAEFVSGP